MRLAMNIACDFLSKKYIIYIPTLRSFNEATSWIALLISFESFPMAPLALATSLAFVFPAHHPLITIVSCVVLGLSLLRIKCGCCLVGQFASPHGQAD